MSQDLSAKNLRLIAQIADMGKLDQLFAAAQAIIEGKPLGESSLDGKLVDYGEGVEAPANQMMFVGGIRYRRHANGGGWVPVDQDRHDLHKPWVSGEAYISPFSHVVGASRIYARCQVFDSVIDSSILKGALIRGSSVSSSTVEDASVIGTYMRRSVIRDRRVERQVLIERF